MVGIAWALLLSSLVVGFPASQAAAAEQDFYKGKTVRIIVGFSAGGGFDAYARAIARHLGRHLPGGPTVIVENMPGAGSRVAANYLFRAQGDGLTIGNFIGSLVLQQVMGDKGIEFDGRKFEWLGAPVQDEGVCALTKASGIHSLDDWFAAKKPVKLGGEAPGANDSDVPRVLKAALGLPIQLIEGFKGTSNIRLAAESGEVDGGCWTWASIRTTWAKGLESGMVKPILQINPKKAADIPDVPNAIDYAKTPEARTLIEAGVHAPSAILRAYALPPGTPKERLGLLRRAFAATMKDQAFLAEMNKSRLEVNPLSGEEVEAIVRKLFQMDSATVARIREVLVPKK
ncbi:MAG TPA: tripartite tricarboxylate transporter substrate-binding protein [candidate division Zixibacteria bacterium]|nr:tripartite tricarboxylate transporter substrate-binding protein [candidate division Zixibacteria bacterium]